MGMAERIKERRKAMGYTQTELGEKLGLQASAIAKYENGRVENIKRSIIADMARVLECSPCYLLDWEKEQTEPKTYPKIMQYYDRLNDIGKHEATKRVEEMTHAPQYMKRDTDYLAVQAAHNDAEINDEELGKMERDSALMVEMAKQKKK